MLTLAAVALVLLAGGYYFLFLRKPSSKFIALSPSLIKWTAPKEASKSWKGEVVSDNSLRVEGSPDKIRCFDPATGYLIGYEKAMTKEEVSEIVKKARAAQAQWSKTSFGQRKQFLQLLNDFIIQNQAAIAQIASRDSGKTAVDASFGEILTTCEKIRWTNENGEKYLQTEYRDVCWLMVHKSARVEYRPLGVIGAIVSWNYPFHNMLGPMISALFAGNACVVKVSEHTAWSSKLYENMVHQILAACGHSTDLFRVITGFAESGQALIDAKVDKLTFIGSPKVGKMVMKAASEHLTPVLLELGGKDAAVICDDCDFDQVCNLGMRGTFQSCGQNCIGLERMVVHERIYDRFVKEIEGRVKKLTQGPPMVGQFDTGALVMAVELDRLESLIQDAVSKGARLLAGGKRNVIPDFPKGQYFMPTLLVDVTPEMRIAQEEVFGPIMSVFRFRDENDAVRIVNSCEFGLGGSVFSRDYAKAERITDRIHTGMANINDFAVNYLCQSLPFGGVKVSGFDRFAGIEGLRGNCFPKAVTTDRFPGVRTNIPPPLNYPMTAAGFEFCSSLCTLFYGPFSQFFSSALKLATTKK